MSLPSTKSKRRPPAYSSKPASINANEAKRKCLFCGANFISEWSGNRICNRCKQLSEFKGSLG